MTDSTNGPADDVVSADPTGDDLSTTLGGAVELKRLADRLDFFERALRQLREIVRALPTDEQAERAIRTENKVSRLLSFALIPIIVMAGLSVVVLVAANQTRHAAHANRAGVQCILAELAEHRNANHSLNSAIAEKLGVDVNGARPTLLPGPPTVEEIERKCGMFYEHRVAEP